jgi:hypothetical protein
VTTVEALAEGALDFVLDGAVLLLEASFEVEKVTSKSSTRGHFEFGSQKAHAVRYQPGWRTSCWIPPERGSK